MMRSLLANLTLRRLAAALAVVALSGVAALAQDGAGEPPVDPEKAAEAAEAEARPNPLDPITVDFVKRDVHTVMHYIAIRSGLQVIVQGNVEVLLTVMFRDVLPAEAIKSICKANELEFVEDGNTIIIKRRMQDTGLANVVKGDEPGRFHVAFEAQELVAAIMEVAKVTQTQTFVPTQPQAMEQTGSSGQPAPDSGQPLTEAAERRGEQRVIQIQQRKISMYMRNADPDSIMKRLAQVGDLLLQPDMASGYFFEYKRVLGGEESEGSEGFMPKPLLTREWTLPGTDVTAIKGEITNLLSPRGKIIIHKDTNYLMLIDREEVVDRVSPFLDKVGALALANQEAAAMAADDPLVVESFELIRDLADGAVVTAITALLTPQGRVTPNSETNSVIVTERTSRMPLIRRLMAGLDGMPNQVLITARLVEVSLESYMGYGLQLFTSQPVDSWKDGVVTGSSRNSTGTVGGLFGNPTGFSPFVGTFVNDVLDARLELLANDGKVKTLIAPSQMVSNRKPARIEVGQEIPYVESTSTGTGTGTQQASVSFKEVSAVMDVLPTIFDSGIIRLQITVTVREVIGNAALVGNNTPILSKRESKTDVYLRDGETIVMGGLLRERERMDENGLPFLKDIPFLGYLFKTTNKVTSKTDLMFFIRPTIVSALGPRNETHGIGYERDLTPLVLDPADAEKASMRPGAFRVGGKTPKPAHFNESTRPKSPADVKPGA